MQRIRVNSTTLLSVGYDSDQNVLELEFTSTGIYKYYDVPGYKYLGLMVSASQGLYFNENIKDKYPHKKVDS